MAVLTTYTFPADVPDQNGIFTAGHEEFLYNVFRGKSEYIFETHRVQLPIVGTIINPLADTSVTVKTADTTAKRRIKFKAERFGAWPVLPEPTDTFVDQNGITNTLIDVKVIPENPIPGANEVSRYRMEVEYLYAMSRVPTITERLRSVVDPRVSNGQHNATATSPTVFTGGQP